MFAAGSSDKTVAFKRNSFLKQKLSLKQNTIDKHLEISSSQCKDISYSKEKGKKTIDIAKKKDTSCEFINSDVPPTSCSLNEQQRKSYRVIAQIALTVLRNSEFLRHMISTQTRKKICQHRFRRRNHCRTVKKVILLGDSMFQHQKSDILSKSGNKVNVKFYPGATTEDITDHLRPAMKKKPDAIIIHTGTNDLMNDTNTMKHVRSITKIIGELKVGSDI